VVLKVAIDTNRVRIKSLDIYWRRIETSLQQGIAATRHRCNKISLQQDIAATRYRCNKASLQQDIAATRHRLSPCGNSIPVSLLSFAQPPMLSNSTKIHTEKKVLDKNYWRSSIAYNIFVNSATFFSGMRLFLKWWR